jgi:hypothetical protein
MMKVLQTSSFNTKRPSSTLSSMMVPPRKRRRYEYDSDSSEDESDLSDYDSDSDDDCDELAVAEKRHRRVRFATTKSYSPLPKHYRPMKSECWWTKSDRQEFIEDCHDCISDFRLQDQTDVVQQYMKVFDHATSKPSHASSDFLEKATLCLPTSIRGLEWGIVPSSTKSKRRDHVQEILTVQEQTKNISNRSFRDRLLASRSIKSSRPSRIVAKLLGEGDAKSLLQEEGKKYVLHDEHKPFLRPKCKMLPSSW